MTLSHRIAERLAEQRAFDAIFDRVQAANQIAALRHHITRELQAGAAVHLTEKSFSVARILGIPVAEAGEIVIGWVREARAELRSERV